jgi:hypothetical protein
MAAIERKRQRSARSASGIIAVSFLLFLLSFLAHPSKCQGHHFTFK